MEGLAKAAPPTVEEQASIPAPKNDHATDSIGLFTGVSTDLMRYFGAEFRDLDTTCKSRLNDIYNWAKEECGDKADNINILKKISSLETKLGVPSWHEKRWDRVWNYVRLSVNINDLLKHREILEKK